MRADASNRRSSVCSYLPVNVLELVHDLLDGDGGTDGALRDQIVATGVADLGQGIVLAKERNRRSCTVSTTTGKQLLLPKYK